MMVAANSADNLVPVLVITGYLGSGKTTLINQILTNENGKKYALLINEFGDIGIDAQLITTSNEELIELNNGCICCVIRGDLVIALRDLLDREINLDGIFIETTGLADPGPVIQTFFADQILQSKARLDSVITVVDAIHILDQLADSEEPSRQIGFADQIILNKAGSIDAAKLAAIENGIKALNPISVIHRCERCRIEPSLLLQRQDYDLAALPERLTSIESEPHIHDANCDHAHDADNHLTTSNIESFSLISEKAMNSQKLELWLEELLTLQSQEILRSKGIINAKGNSRKIVFQSVNMMLEGEELDEWPDNEIRTSRLVFIGRKLDTASLKVGFKACYA